jgi:alpha-galactosidase
MNILLQEAQMTVCFQVREDGIVELVDFSAEGCSKTRLDSTGPLFGTGETNQLLAVQVTGESATGMHAYKHNTGSVSDVFYYVSHEITENEKGRLLSIEMKAANGLHAVYYMQFYTGIPAVRTWSVLRNDGTEDIGIEYVSSFIYNGISKNGSQPYFDKTDIYVPRNSWCNEAQWQKYDAADLGLSYMPVQGYNLPAKGNNRFHYDNCGSWSTCEYLPMGMARDRETGEIYYFEIDHSGSWEIEYGSGSGQNLYLALLGPNDESIWWKRLTPGQEFTTVPAAFGVCIGEESEAIAALTRYRRAIRRKNQDNEQCYVVFNDYMNCLMGDPTEEKEKEIIDKAAELGCEYYCMDCGWYDSGFWWDKVGEWKESPERFPNGLKSVYEYAASRNIKMGMWLEIEVMGTECELASKLPDDWFICTHGKRRIDNKRYLLDFRNPEVRKYCSDVIDRLIADYGVQFFKIDYNVTTGPGSDLYTESMGDAMLEHYRYLYQWYEDIYRKYPDLIIENCGSGAQRMDYGMLALQSLQSTSDQTDYISNSHIAANVACAVTPEQAGMWVYPYEDNAEHVIYNMVNGILLRPYVSGLVWDISEENFRIFQEGIAVYKEVRKDLTGMVPFFPLGFGSVKSPVLAYGVKNEGKAYLSVFTPEADYAEIPLERHLGTPREVRVIYPKAELCEYSCTDGVLRVKMPRKQCARLFEIFF